MQTKNDRVAIANKFIEAVATHGRKFFAFEGRVSNIERTAGGKLFFVDSWNGKRIYISRHGGEWHGFHNGGTLRALVQWLVAFIHRGQQMPAGLFGRHWAYGDDMKKVIAIGQSLGFVGPTERDFDAEMKLPAGSTCADCCNVSRCVDVLGCTKPGNTSCDFHPSRFVAVTLEPATAN
jgi:hypothetical protein